MAKHVLNRLKDRQIRTSTGPARLQDGGGLSIRITRSGSKSWIFRYTFYRKQREVGLGGYPAVTLQAARKLAAEGREMVKGTPPNDPMQAWFSQSEEARINDAHNRQSVIKFASYADEYILKRESSWRTIDTPDQWRRSLRKHAPEIMEKPIDEVCTSDLENCLLPIWVTLHPTAKRVRSRIENILDSATIIGLRSGLNPARFKGHLEHILPKVSHKPKPHPAIHYTELPALYLRLEQCKRLSARIIQFDILTAARSGEARGARWDEIDFNLRLWSLKSNRMKSEQPHIVPLSSAAIGLLQNVDKIPGNALVFPSPVNLSRMSDKALMKTLKLMGAKSREGSQATVHGMRSVFSDYFGEETELSEDLAEYALAHRVKGVKQSYRRMRAVERRRNMMEQWGDFCTGTISLDELEMDGPEGGLIDE